MSTEGARYRIDLESLLTRSDMVWGDPDGPPADWRAGSPIGNGDFGAMVYGYPDSMGLVLGKSDVWDRRNDEQSYFPGKTFSEFREAVLDPEEKAYEKIQEDHTASYDPQGAHLTTCGRLRLHLDEVSRVISCTLRTHLKDGLASLSWGPNRGPDPCRAASFVSRQFDVLCISVDRIPEDGRQDPVPWELSRPRLDDNPLPELTVADDACFLTQRFVVGGCYVIAIAALEGQCVAEESVGRLVGALTGDEAGKCSLILTIVSSWDNPDPLAEAKRRLKAAKAAGREEILQTHRNWWEDYWLRGLASVGDPGVEQWYYRSLYLCGSALEPGKQSPGLQGLWVGENYPPWRADFHGDVNIQALYWGLFTNNRLDMMEPYLSHYHRTADVARQDAAGYFQMRGLRFPIAGTIGGCEWASTSASILKTEPCCSSWITQLFWQYYEWTLDEEFLREVAYPLLRDVALFFTDYLTWDDQGQRWTVVPAVHFEADHNELRTPALRVMGSNSLYAHAMFYGAFKRAIAAADVLGVDEEHVATWRERLEGLYSPPVTEEGYWKAWENRPPTYSGHNYMLPHVFPAELVSRHHGPAAWRQQAQATWKHLRESSDSCSTGEVGFGGQGICEVLRLGDRDWAFRGARFPQDPRWWPHGTTRIWEAGIFQAETGAGVCRMLADMVLLCLDGVIYLFDGVPDDVPARFHSLRAAGAFLISAERRTDLPDYVLVRSLAGRTLRLANPWPGRSVSVLSSAEAKQIETGPTEVIEMQTREQADYLITAAGTAMESIPIVDFAVAVPDPGQTDRPTDGKQRSP